MSRVHAYAPLLLRIAIALTFIPPGGMKLFHWFGGMPPGVTLTPLLWTAGAIEIVGGALVVLGLFTRPVAFLCSGEMAVAYFKGHFAGGFWPIQNHGEPAALLCFMFLLLSATGAGPFALDHVLWRRRGDHRAAPGVAA